MRLRCLRGLVFILALSLSTLTGAAHAQANPSQQHISTSKLVRFEGSLINLADGWGAAHACVIWEQAHASMCFRTEAEMAQHIMRVKQTRSPNVTIASACASALNLYQDNNFGGRHLQFFDRGFWQNLGNFGFNDALSSYKVGACGVHLAENANGGGLFYPGNTSAGAQSSCMCAGSTNWNDRVSSIFIT